MKIFEGLANFVPVKNAVVTSGTFDGVHLGHQKILKRIRDIADQFNGETVLITFWPHPRLVLFPHEHNLRLLSTFEEKAKLLREYGIDHLVTLPFTKEFSEMSSEDFIQKILVEKIQTKKLVIGYDHRFGKNREGSFEYLKENIQKYHFELEEIPREDIDHVGISSSKIRRALEIGNIEIANEYLGRDYELNGIIIKGQQLGRSIGFPTANIYIPNDYKLVPCDGAYAVKVSVEGAIYKGMLNIGMRPTVDGTSRSIEVNLFDFNGDLYDLRVCVYFKAYLRPEVKFSNLESLKAQLENDRIKAIEILSQQ
ncbi:riboflavin biosynthesis protein RibF [Rhodonellum psychrophilum GCM71 = DSM 17998]|uniref:Riboflavin biosynthesis protein n=2 Tax=Rhodonellum TaxID=336827 RepID=U5BYX6_9BACT|nr:MULTISPECIES: bifunctional riboflavin kinase/FAD synthetase [Rhodonellum]ERM81841.1 riboflavin biosynthesis protein RibF [Rhodonellum psychrophilum GCM71 = DSM 17998]SDY81577.1 riboflavin kinase / FMN adenylyltransferase [Rhodonellum ikkaensis]